MVKVKALGFEVEKPKAAQAERYNCQLCQQNFLWSDMVQFVACRDRLCKACTQFYYQNRITNQADMAIKCPCCSEPQSFTDEQTQREFLAFQTNFIQNLVPPDILQLYQYKLANQTKITTTTSTKESQQPSAPPLEAEFIPPRAPPRKREPLCPKCKVTTLSLDECSQHANITLQRNKATGDCTCEKKNVSKQQAAEKENSEFFVSNSKSLNFACALRFPSTISMFTCEHAFCHDFTKLSFECQIFTSDSASLECPLCNKPQLEGHGDDFDLLSSMLDQLVQNVVSAKAYEKFSEKLNAKAIGGGCGASTSRRVTSVLYQSAHSTSTAEKTIAPPPNVPKKQNERVNRKYRDRVVKAIRLRTYD